MNIRRVLVVFLLSFYSFLLFPSKVFAQTQSTPLFYDFSNGSTDEWTFGCSVITPWICGNWRIVNGTLTQDTGADNVIALIKDRQFTDQTIETQVKLNGPSGYGGIILWQKDNYNWVTVQVYPAAGIVFVGEWANGAPSSYQYSYNFLSNNPWYDLRVEANSANGNLNVYVSGNYLFSYTAMTLNRTGSTGVSSGNAGGYFDNFKLEENNSAVITVGANLNAYIPPTIDQCNIKVPSQYPTIQTSINAANSGDTVCVGPGIYNEDVLINKSIQLSGRGASQSIINGQASNWGSGALEVVATNVVVEGFSIHGKGTNPANAAVYFRELTSSTTLRYNKIVAGDGGLALLTDNWQDNNLIRNNVLEGNNSPNVALVNAFDANKPSVKVDFLNNTLTGTSSYMGGDTGWVLQDSAPNSLIRQNAFNTTGIITALIVSNPANIINENNLNSDTNVKVKHSGAQYPYALNAENNWWGDADPSDNIYGYVDFTPFALNPFPEYPLPVLNQPPVITSISPIASVLPDTQINASATFTDPDISDVHTATWDWGDGSSISSGNITEANGSGSVTGSHSYVSPGTYTITLTVSDGTDTTTANTSVTILTPLEAINNTIDLVQTYNLQQGIENSLDAKLSATKDSLNSLNNHNDVAAVNSLQAFINAVNAQRGNKITDAQADTLIAEANALITYLTPFPRLLFILN